MNFEAKVEIAEKIYAFRNSGDREDTRFWGFYDAATFFQQDNHRGADIEIRNSAVVVCNGKLLYAKANGLMHQKLKHGSVPFRPGKHWKDPKTLFLPAPTKMPGFRLPPKKLSKSERRLLKQTPAPAFVYDTPFDEYPSVHSSKPMSVPRYLRTREKRKLRRRKQALKLAISLAKHDQVPTISLRLCPFSFHSFL